ncbi:MAG: cytosine permease [Bacteroidota bacterium]
MKQQEKQLTKWPGLASIWIGGMISIPSLLIGSTLIDGLSFYQAIFGGLMGIGFVAVYMCLESIAAVRFRLNTVQLARSSFGQKGGTLLIGLIVGLATMGWFGVQTNIAGISFSKLIAETFSYELPEAISSCFWGVVMLLTAVYGFRFMKWLNYLAAPAILFLMIYGLTVSFQDKGFDNILAFQPDQPMGLLTAIGLAIGFVSVGGVISPDINRFAKTEKDAIWGSILGIIPGGILLLTVGAMLSILQGTHDITEIFSRLGYPVLALSILILATWTTNVINAYSGGLAVNQMLNLPEEKRPLSTLIAGAVGTLLAVMGIMNHFIGFLMILTTTIPPIAGVLIGDLWLAKSFDFHKKTAFNFIGFAAWGAGVLIMVLLEDPVKNLLSIFISAIAFWIMNLLFGSEKQIENQLVDGDQKVNVS